MNRVKNMTLLALLVFSSWAYANTNPKKLAANAAAQNLAAITVYLDVNLLARKHQAAKNMTEMHQAFFEQGYELLILNPYLENGDLQGFYISYKKM